MLHEFGRGENAAAVQLVERVKILDGEVLRVLTRLPERRLDALQEPAAAVMALDDRLGPGHASPSRLAQILEAAARPANHDRIGAASRGSAREEMADRPCRRAHTGGRRLLLGARGLSDAALPRRRGRVDRGAAGRIFRIVWQRELRALRGDRHDRGAHPARRRAREFRARDRSAHARSPRDRSRRLVGARGGRSGEARARPRAARRRRHRGQGHLLSRRGQPADPGVGADIAAAPLSLGAAAPGRAVAGRGARLAHGAHARAGARRFPAAAARRGALEPGLRL